MKLQSRLRLKYIASDFLAANIAWFVFNLVRYFTLPYNYATMTLSQFYSMTVVKLGQIIFPLMMVALYAVSGYYNNVFKKSRTDEFLNTFGISFLGTVIIFLVALYNDSIDDRMQNYEMIFILWCLLSVIAYIPRMIITTDTLDKIAKGAISFGTLIVGTSDKALAMARDLKTKYPHMGLRVEGFVAMNPTDADSRAIPDDYRIINAEDLQETVKSMGIEALIVVHENSDTNVTIDILNRLFPLGTSIFLTPDMFHIVASRPRTSTIAGEVLIDVAKCNVKASTLNIKRISDIIVSSVALVTLSPLLLAIALMVKRDSPGPVIYKQERMGRNKKKFNIYKFRSMYTDSEANGPSLSSENDPRITPMGRTLRKYRLDELPQFWNVLRGDMSLVGPRPERDFYFRQVVEKAPYCCLLHQVRPGITSWGMVKFGYAKSVDQMISRYKYDLLYLDNLTIAVDIKILLYTVKTVITGKGV